VFFCRARLFLLVSDRTVRSRDKETQVKARTFIVTVTGSLALIVPAAHAAGSGAQTGRQLQNLVYGDGIFTPIPSRHVTAIKKHRIAVAPLLGPHTFQVVRNAF
jgi:hypothetical protein